MTSRMPLVWLAFLAVLLAGCDSAEDMVNSRLPPVPSDHQRTAAIQAAQAAVARLGDANAGFSLRIEDIAAALRADGFAERLGVGQLSLRGDRQLLLADVDVAKTFSRDDFPDLDAHTKDLIEGLRPEITGRIALGLDLTIAQETSEDGGLTLGLHVLPVFRNVQVERVVLAGKPDVDVLVALMNRLADAIGSELSRVEIARTSFPALSFRQARSLAVKGPDGIDESITLSAEPAPPPLHVRSAAWLVDQGSVTLVAELARARVLPVPATAAPAEDDYAQLQAEFSKKLAEGLGVTGPTGANWIAVSKGLVARIVNAAFEQARPCIGMKVSLADREFSSKVDIPGSTAMDCTPRMECTPVRDCTAANRCQQTEDCRQARDCQVCALGACFDDPACERQRAGARYDCEVRKAARQIECESRGTPERTACETQRAAEQASCEARRAALKLGCEAGKQGLAKLAGTGALAGLAGTIGGSADVSVCIGKLAAAPALERLEASAIVSGRGTVDLGIKYVPSGIADYFDCRFPWAESKRVTVVVPGQPARLDAALALEPSSSNLILRASIKTSALPARIHPDPRELVLANYSMRGTCVPAGKMLNATTLDVAGSVPAIDADFKLPGEEHTLVLTMAPMTFRSFGIDMVAGAVTGANAKALILTSDQPAAAAN